MPGKLWLFLAVLAAGTASRSDLDALVQGVASPPPNAVKNFTLSLLECMKSRFPNKKLIFILENDYERDRNLSSDHRSMSYLILMDSEVFFGYSNPSFILENFHWTSNTYFVVVAEQNPDDDMIYLADENDSEKVNLIQAFGNDSFYREKMPKMAAKREIQAFLKTFWVKKIFNVIVAKPKKSKIHLYTYFPYTPTNCIERLVPALVDLWDMNTFSFVLDRNLFPKKTRHLYGCSLNISLVINPPAIIPEGKMLNGIEGRVIMKILGYLNATANFRFAEPIENSQAMESVLNDVGTGMSDMGAGFLIPTKIHQGRTDDVYIPINLCLTWAVPNHVMVKNFVVYIFEAFNAKVWLVVFTSIVISILAFRLMQRVTIRDLDSLEYATVKIISAYLGIPGTPPTQTQLKVFLIFCTCFSIFLTNAFQAGLGSNKIIIQPRSQVDTIKDIAKSNLKIKGLDQAADFFDGILSKLGVKEKEIELGKGEEILMMVGLERQTLVIGFQPTMNYYRNVLFPDLRGLVHIHKSCVVNFMPFIALQKSSPFTNHVNRLVTVLTENGIVARLLNNFTTNNGDPKPKMTQMDFDMILFYGALEIWSYGMYASVGIFIIELGINKLMKRFLRSPYKIKFGNF